MCVKGLYTAHGFERFEGLTTEHIHDGLTTTVTPPAGASQASSRTHNAAGDLIRATDAGGTIYYYYYAPGFVRRIVAPGNAITTITYDPLGRQASLTDPNAGTITFVYDAFDRIISQTTARGHVTENRFDRFGRLERVTESGRVTTYTYITDPNDPNVGRLRSISVDNGTAHTFDYDHLGRIRRFTDVSGSNTFVTEYTYDVFGNLQTYRFPSGFILFYVYDDNGFKREIRENNASGLVIWQLGSVNALGQERRSFADGRLRTQEFNAFGQPTRMTVQDLMDFTYEYYCNTGNMRSRRNDYSGTNETFSYDNLNRLTTGVTFSPCGNIERKEGVGEFIYTAVRPHAVDTILGFLDPRFDHDISYTSFQKVQTITAHNSPAFLHANFVYGPNRQRRQMNVIFGDNVLSKHYTQNFEVSYINGARVETKEYIFSPFGLVAIRNNGEINAVATDHLGSIVARFNPRVGDYEFFGYTAWGRRYRYDRATSEKHFFDHSAGADVPSVPINILDYFARGFTGHEHMDAFGLINMNGRMYDPVIGRFLSPDPFVPDATFTQDFNRYMYARNNPLSYIDPCGNFVIPIIIGAAIGAYLGGAIQSGNWNPVSRDFWQNGWQGAIAGGLLGAAGGAMLASGIGASGVLTAGGEVTRAFGITSSILNSSAINIGMNAIQGGGWDGAWKAGLVGLGTGAWGATGGFGMVNAWGSQNAIAGLGGRLGYQAIGTAGGSIGNNWASGVNPFSRVTVGVGPVNLTFGRNQNLLQWQNNLGNIITNAIGLGNLAFGGNVSFEWQDLAFVYTGGLMERMPGAWGPYAVMGPEWLVRSELPHEMHHIWQSRAFGDTFLLHYGMAGVNAMLSTRRRASFILEANFWEMLAYGHRWFRPSRF